MHYGEEKPWIKAAVRKVSHAARVCGFYRLRPCFISWIKAFFLGLRAGCTGTHRARGNAHSLPTHFVAVSPQFILPSHMRLSECRENHLAREGKSNPTRRLRCFLGAYQGSCPRLPSNFRSWHAVTHLIPGK